MKKIKLLLALLCAAFVFVSCDGIKDQAQDAVLTAITLGETIPAIEEGAEIPAAGGTYIVAVITAADEWDATTTSEGCTVSIYGVAVTIKIDENTTGSARTIEVKFATSGNSTTWSHTQAAN